MNTLPGNLIFPNTVVFTVQATLYLPSCSNFCDHSSTIPNHGGRIWQVDNCSPFTLHCHQFKWDIMLQCDRFTSTPTRNLNNCTNDKIIHTNPNPSIQDWYKIWMEESAFPNVVIVTVSTMLLPLKKIDYYKTHLGRSPTPSPCEWKEYSSEVRLDYLGPFLPYWSEAPERVFLTLYIRFQIDSTLHLYAVEVSACLPDIVWSKKQWCSTLQVKELKHFILIGNWRLVNIFRPVGLAL